MTIQYFADRQNVVFVPALLALLVAVLAICLPVVFATALRRSGRGRMRAIVVVAAVVAVVALAVTGVQALAGVHALERQRTQVAEQLQARYGLTLGAGEVDELVNGGSPATSLPALAKALDLRSTKQGKHDLKLKELTDGEFDLTYGGERVPPSA